ncbi:MAG TPA: hypothetical protein VMZ22_01315 [Acidimicrobiales bacterium]|nr:hypothetical protein [Acidimicrobiales bacterium]
MFDTALAAGATALAVAFCVATWERWLLRRRRHELAWSASFACYALASLALTLGIAGDWNATVFRLFYAAGAVATVPVLGLGTVYLHFGRRADALALGIVVVTAIGVGVAIGSPLTHTVPLHEIPQGSELFGAGPRIFAAVGSGVGALVVVGGALYSAVRRRAPLANALIALGVIANGASGLLNSLVGETRGFVVMLAVGITLLFGGFLTATASPTRSVSDARTSTSASRRRTARSTDPT